MNEFRVTPGTRSPGNAPRLTIIIVNYNAWPDVLRLASVLEDEPEFASGELQIAVVDNASQGPMPGETRALPSRWPAFLASAQ